MLQKESKGNPKITRLSHGHWLGGKASPTYRTWTCMRSRCENKSNPSYNNYGGKGITVCERWKTFALFLADMGERPAGKTIDRLDNTKGYYKSNCKWSTMKEQAQNRRSKWDAIKKNGPRTTG